MRIVNFNIQDVDFSFINDYIRGRDVRVTQPQLRI